jgi:hypothetical protein
MYVEWVWLVRTRIYTHSLVVPLRIGNLIVRRYEHPAAIRVRGIRVLRHHFGLVSDQATPTTPDPSTL